MLFVWDDSYNTGIAEIVQDHKALVNLINDLYEAMQDGSGGALLMPILSALKSYTETHVSREEQYMAECNAPDQVDGESKTSGVARVIFVLSDALVDQGKVCQCCGSVLVFEMMGSTGSNQI